MILTQRIIKFRAKVPIRMLVAEPLQRFLVNGVISFNLGRVSGVTGPPQHSE